MWIAGILAVFALSACVTVYAWVYRSWHLELQNRLEYRFASLRSVLELDGDILELELNPGQQPKDAAEYWKVQAPDGQVLWSEEPPRDELSVLWKSQECRVLQLATTRDQLEVKNAEEEIRFSLERNNAASEGSDSFRPRYKLSRAPNELRLTLVMGTARVPMDRALRRTGLFLSIVGPVSVVFLSGALILLVRREVKPLTVMAAQARSIGPDNTEERLRIRPTNWECRSLQTAINAMLSRLHDGLLRERQFASMAAHELRTPLAQWRIQLEVALRKERTPEEYRCAIEGSLADVERLQNLIGALVLYTRTASPGNGSDEGASLAAVCDRTIKEFPSVRWEKDAVCEDVRVRGDEELLHIALRNVLDNAAKYAPDEPPTVRLCGSALRSDTVSIIVSDRGPGVPPGQRERIFQPLFRIDEARTVTDDSGGFGLGLAIARSIVRRFGGDLYCRRREDEAPGAEFCTHSETALRRRNLGNTRRLRPGRLATACNCLDGFAQFAASERLAQNHLPIGIADVRLDIGVAVAGCEEDRWGGFAKAVANGPDRGRAAHLRHGNIGVDQRISPGICVD